MHETVMLADDSSFMREIEKAILEKAGYTIVAQASNGAQAISCYELYKPDIVLMDINMQGMGGVEALKKIIKKHAEAKVIMCSSMGQEPFIAEAISAGAKDFIIKPFKRDFLLRTVLTVLEG